MFSKIYTKMKLSPCYLIINFSVLAQNHLQSSFLEYLLIVALYNYEHGYL